MTYRTLGPIYIIFHHIKVFSFVTRKNTFDLNLICINNLQHLSSKLVAHNELENVSNGPENSLYFIIII